MSGNGENPDHGEVPDGMVSMTNPNGWQYQYQPQCVPGLTSREPYIRFHGPQSARCVISPDGTIVKLGEKGFKAAIENFRNGFASKLSSPQKIES